MQAEGAGGCIAETSHIVPLFSFAASPQPSSLLHLSSIAPISACTGGHVYEQRQRMLLELLKGAARAAEDAVHRLGC